MDGSEIVSMLAALAGTGPDMGSVGLRKGKVTASRVLSGEDVTGVDGNGPTVYVSVQICVTVASAGMAVECAPAVITCSW